MRKYIASILFILVPFFVFAEKYTDLKANDYVNDFANVLTVEQKNELSLILGNLEKQAGVQVAVAVVNNLDGDYIEHYAVKLFEQWGMGKSGSEQDSDRGVLFLVAVDDRQMRIEVGYGLEPILTDGATKNILENFVKPKFKNGDYFTGIKEGVEGIVTVVNGGELKNVENNDLKNGGWFELIIFLLIIGVNILGWLFAIMARSKSWWLGGVVTFAIGFPVLYFFFGLNPIGDLILFILTLGGFLFDYLISRNYKYWQAQSLKGNTSAHPAWWAGGGWGPGGGGFGSSGGSGFGGFGGGSSGGGGSSSSW